MPDWNSAESGTVRHICHNSREPQRRIAIFRKTDWFKRSSALITYSICDLSMSWRRGEAMDPAIGSCTIAA